MGETSDNMLQSIKTLHLLCSVEISGEKADLGKQGERDCLAWVIMSDIERRRAGLHQSKSAKYLSCRDEGEGSLPLLQEPSDR